MVLMGPKTLLSTTSLFPSLLVMMTLRYFPLSPAPIEKLEEVAEGMLVKGPEAESEITHW
jgi:hypothetical protein